MMKLPNPEREDVGVIIGRFQVHSLHEAHMELIDSVISRHDRVLLFIGLSPLRNTPTNPLDFNTRKRMIQDRYKNIEIHYIEDNRSDIVWSRNLDREISKHLQPHQTVMLYGGRDSFVPHYKGRYPTTELESSVFISGTEIRKRIANQYEPDASFRAGMVAAAYSRFPTSYATVDVAIIDKSKNKILLGKKTGETEYRFIGGFADPKSHSYEEDARREVMEETGVEIDDIKYIGSTNIEDWRFKQEIDKIKTLFFVVTYVFGRPAANDDIAELQWFDLSLLTGDKVPIVPEHLSLLEMLKKYLAK